MNRSTPESMLSQNEMTEAQRMEKKRSFATQDDVEDDQIDPQAQMIPNSFLPPPSQVPSDDDDSGDEDNNKVDDTTSKNSAEKPKVSFNLNNNNNNDDTGALLSQQQNDDYTQATFDTLEISEDEDKDKNYNGNASKPATRRRILRMVKQTKQHKQKVII